MTDFIDEIQAASMADAGLKRLKMLELAEDIGVEVGRLLESGNQQLDRQLALAWKLRERDVRAILAKSKRWGAGSHLRQLESHIRGLSEDVESQDDDENESSGPSGFDPEVLERLEKTEKGVVRPTLSNIVEILSSDPSWKGRVALNSFADQLEIDNRPLSDADEYEFLAWMTPRYGPDPSSVRIHEAFVTVATRNAYHPVRNYLNSLAWDGVKRLDTWIPRHMGVADSPLARAYSRKFLISMVARIFRPGCKVDTALILHGTQGAMKSSALKALADPWFSDTSIEIGSKDGYQTLSGSWLVEVAELDSFAKRENSAVKAYLSSAEDRFRPSYGRNTVLRRRETVFCGSTNKDDFLNDDSGSRRYWIVTVSDSIDVESIRAERDQLFAEALLAFNAGEEWHLSREMDRARAAASEPYRQIDPWEPALAAYLAGDPGAGIRPRTGPFTIGFLLEVVVGLQKRDMNKNAEMRMAAALRGLGWKKDASRRPVVWAAPAD